MKRITKSYGAKKITTGSNQYTHLLYQEIKTEWGSRKRKVRWIMPYKPTKNNDDGK